MGNLRVESKTKGMDQEKYKELAALLNEARSAADDNRIFYDLDPDEKGNAVRLDLIYVARKEGIGVRVRKLRKQHALELTFQSESARSSGSGRISAEDFKQRVIDILRSENRPLKRGEILQKTGLSASSWHIRIVELLKEGKVVKTGERRQAVYTLA